MRACHVTGSFTARDNRRPPLTVAEAAAAPTRDTNRIVLPPANFLHEVEKIEKRWPAGIDFVRQHRLNEHFGTERDEIGIIVQGGLFNSLNRALELLDLSDAFGNAALPVYVLNVTYPLIPDEVQAFCAGKRAVLVVEEGQPEFIEHELNTLVRRADLQTRIVGRMCCRARANIRPRSSRTASPASCAPTPPTAHRPKSPPSRPRCRRAQCRSGPRASAPAAPNGRSSRR